jgi:hypothetical protein
VRQSAEELPESLEWDRLAAEMTANIRVGLAAGECVSPRTRKLARLSWRPAAVMAGVVALLTVAWWANMPAADSQSLARAMRSIIHGGRQNLPPSERIRDDRGPVVEASESGIELRENGSRLGMSHSGLRPVAVSVSVQGSASARYIDADTGQVTITSVYVQ